MKFFVEHTQCQIYIEILVRWISLKSGTDPSRLLEEEDPLYIERIIKEEIVADLQNGVSSFEFFDCSRVDNDYDYPVNENLNIKLEEKFKITINKVESLHYKHFIHFYCSKCQLTSDVHFRKSRRCKNGNCLRILKYQCMSCGDLFKHYSSAFVHVKKHHCEKLHESVKTEIKTEFNHKNSNKYNPYNNKIKKNKIHKNECPKCFKACKTRVGLTIHMRYCGLKRKIKCEYCAFKCKMEIDLMKHMTKHVKLENKESEQIKTLEKVKIHQKTTDMHTLMNYVESINNPTNSQEKCENVEGYFYCAHCHYNTNNRYNLAGHIECRHSELYPSKMFTCKLCGVNCKTTYRLHYHLKKQCKQKLANLAINTNVKE